MYNRSRWCYVAYDIDSDLNIGVYNKIKSQQSAIARQVGKCDLIIYKKNKIYTIVDNIENERVYHSTAEEDIAVLEQYDYLYVRCGLFYKQYKQMLRPRNNRHYNVIVEIPTYPIKDELWAKAKVRLRRGQLFMAIRSFFGGIYLQDILFKSQIKYIDYLVIISYMKDINGVRCIHIDNGIDVARTKVCKNSNESSKVVMMMVANIAYWQGIDRVIEGIAKYDDKENVEFRVVGEGQEKSSLIRLVEKKQLQSNVKFLGIKNGKELDDLFDECDVAIGSLGLARKKIVGSTLKTREYMARGIPFVASNFETIGDDIKDDVCFVEDNDTPVDISKIVDYVKSIDRKAVSDRFRAFAMKKISWDVQMKKVMSEI